MSPKILMAIAAVLAIACTTIEEKAAGDQVRYGKVAKAEVVDGPGHGLQHLVVKMPDGSVVDVTQERNSGILMGDVVRVYGSGPKARVEKL